MKKTKLFSLTLIMLLVVSLIFTGCSNDAATATTEDADNNDAGTTEDVSTTTDTQVDEQIIIGYNAYGDTVDFSKNVTAGLEAAAEAIGAKVLKADTNGDAATALANVDAFITQGADIIIDSSWVVSACEAVAQKCDENGIPCIISDIWVDTESAYYMGVDNDQVGRVTGEFVVEYANENWGGEIDQMLISFVEAFGEGVKPRVSGVPLAVQAAGIDLPEEKITYVDPEGSDATVVSKQQGTDFLTAHPDDKHIVMVACNEQAAQGLLAAVETSNRTDDCIVVSVGLDSIGIANLYKDEATVWLGSTAFFPENYGDILVSMVQGILAGEDVEKAQYIDNIFVTKDLVTEYYPDPNA